MSLVDKLSFDPKVPLPRSNGELVFENPWESRVFGLAAALADQGVFDWRDFQAGLIAAIAEHERTADPSEVYRYYDHWLKTLETLVVERGLVAPQDIDGLAEEYAERPHGHDHDGHDHDHDHHH